MSDLATKIIITLIIIGTFAFVVLIYWLGNSACSKYGSNWHFRGGYANYCVNENGDVKGI